MANTEISPCEKQMLKDNKRLTHVGWVPFLACLIVLLPVYLIVILPSTIALKILGFCCGPCLKALGCGKRPSKSNDFESAEETLGRFSELNIEPAEEKSRVYDVVLLGATGFTGGLAAEYITKQYGSDIKWAIAGRTKRKLEAVSDKLTELGLAKPIDQLICDTSDVKQLADLCNSTRVVMSTVGPFNRYGNELVAACAFFGTSYCDITGESDWVHSTYKRFNETAKKTGARIVHYCGHDCIPWDLSVYAVAKILREEKGEELKAAQCFDQLKSAPSGGTLETMMDFIQGRAACRVHPDDRKNPSPANEFKTRNVSQMIPSYNRTVGAWCGPFIMSMVMYDSVRSSNYANKYGKALTYYEGVQHTSFKACFVEFLGLITFATSLSNPILCPLLRRFLPQSGQGPSVKQQENGYLKIKTFGTGTGGSRAKAEIYFPKDAGYRDTSRMLVESALALSLDADRLDVGGGVMTPGIAFKDVIIERLVATGCTFTCDLVDE